MKQVRMKVNHSVYAHQPNLLFKLMPTGSAYWFPPLRSGAAYRGRQVPWFWVLARAALLSANRHWPSIYWHRSRGSFGFVASLTFLALHRVSMGNSTCSSSMDRKSNPRSTRHTTPRTYARQAPLFGPKMLASGHFSTAGGHCRRTGLPFFITADLSANSRVAASSSPIAL